MTEKAAAADGGGVIGLIRDLLSAFALPAELCGLGFRCGLVGYFAYDFVRCLENLPDNNPDDLFLPDCDLSVPGEVVLYDHLKHELTLVCNQWASRGCNADHRADYRAAARILQGLAGALSAGSPPVQQAGTQPAGTDGFWSNVSRERFLGQVRLARQYIRQGDIFQVVLSQRFSAVFGGDPFAVYRALRQVNPSPYLFYLQLPGAVLAGASPEMLVRLTGKQIETCPIAGTRRRGATAEDDDRLAAGLLLDSKELAEHAMLVDLARNDVGRISRFGSVEVKDFCHVERFSHVMHLVSLVNGELCDDASAIDVLASLLPAGTLSGAPKIRAMEIIDELETCRRGPYGGAVGYLGFDGSLDTCITIRTALIARERIHVQAGAGIVADSVPENEYEETVSKAMALFSAIGRAGDFQ
jgi:anthranilate synthase component 1